MEFFENKEDLKEAKIITGRPWMVEELRNKSNEELHKLWYVLLKERNKLFTMQEFYHAEAVAFPSPERIFKVEESMRNIMQVIKERERAINVLETGKTGDLEDRTVRNFLGMIVKEKPEEKKIPPSMNVQYQLTHSKREKWMIKYLRLQKEKNLKQEKKFRRSKQIHMQKLSEKFPHLSEEELEYSWEQYLEEGKKIGSYKLTEEE